MKTRQGTPPDKVLQELGRHVLVDGFKIVIDLQKSWGSHLVDAATGREFLDLYGFYGSLPIGFNHPRFNHPDVQAELLQGARTKVANSDVYTSIYADFVKTLSRVMGLPPLERYFFIDGGALAVENALKAAMDWKVRKNLAAGRGERGTEILHFERAFHGRSGYTLSLTNTEPLKTQYFAKFNWPRVPSPFLDFHLDEPGRTEDVARRERLAEERILQYIEERGIDIAAVIIEPIQGEGGDNHFRAAWFQALRRLCDDHEMLLIFDEVQTGMGMTGRDWCCQHFDVLPDLLVFGKKSQACGVMAGPRLDEVRDNVFRLPSRINSTWGGNLTDMARATHCLNIIEAENLVEHARKTGDVFLRELRSLQEEEPLIAAARGRGLMLAFDLPDRAARDTFYQGLMAAGVLALKCGPNSIRFRPALDFPEDRIPFVLDQLRAQCHRMRDTVNAPSA